MIENIGRSLFLMSCGILAGCSSALESYGTSTGIATTIYVSTEKTKTQDIAQAFRQFGSRERLSCSRPVNAPRDILDSCDGQGGLYITMVQESGRVKFFGQAHPSRMMHDADGAKASLAALTTSLADDLRGKFGDAVQKR
jgi:hypothetical protein